MKKILHIVSLFFFVTSFAFAEESAPITEKQIAEITQTLRHVLDENRKLSDRNEETSAELKNLQNQFQDIQKKSSGNSDDIEAIKQEQSRLSQDNERLKSIIQNFKEQLDVTLDQKDENALSGRLDYSQMKVTEKADLAAEKSVQIQENTADAYYQMADEFFASGDYAKALEYYQKCLSLNPDSRFVDAINRQIAVAQERRGY